MIGVVKFFDATKNNFGFITPDEPGQPDVFLHLKDLQKSGLDDLAPGQTVFYETYVGRSGKPSACNIEVI